MEEWDSSEYGALPSAIKIIIEFRAPEEATNPLFARVASSSTDRFELVVFVAPGKTVRIAGTLENTMSPRSRDVRTALLISPRDTRRQGSVLLVVLVIVAMLSLGAYTFSEIMVSESQATAMYGAGGGDANVRGIGNRVGGRAAW